MEEKFAIIRSSEFDEWLASQNLGTQVRVNSRFQRIVLEGHFGVTNYFDGIVELKWRSGLRVYVHRKAMTVVAL